MKIIGKIQDYIGRVLGFELEESSNTLKLPVPYNHFFDGELCEMGGQEYGLLVSTVDDVKLAVLIQRIVSVEGKLGKSCVYVTDNIDATQRRQFIQKHINFVVPDKQLFLPSMGAFLTEKRLSSRKGVSNFAPTTTYLLLYHLQKQSLEDMKLGEIAELLGFPLKTISTIAAQLQEAGLCELVALQGNAKSLLFKYTGKQLWERALPLMASPIQKVVYVNEEETDGLDLKVAYDNALSHYTEMSDSAQRCFAINKQDEVAKRLSSSATTTNYPGSVRLELWKFNPIETSDANYIDPLSMALCYKDDTDERVAGQIERLIDRLL